MKKEKKEERREKGKESYVRNEFVHNHLSGKQYRHENVNSM